MSKVIAAISTAISPSGLGVIRVSGEEAITVAAAVFEPLDSMRPLTALAGYRAAFGHVHDAEGVIDECVATVFRAPHSYTGENTVELSCHGGLYLLRRTLRALFAAGAVPAEAGEFTKRAFLNGKMDLTRAEAVMSLIAADGKRAADAAREVQEGELFHRLSAVRETLIGLQAQFSAYVDYPYEEIPELEPNELLCVLSDAENSLCRLLNTYDAGKALREGVNTVIVGSPNVGKSTLMNCLAGCDRSIVTPIAGTTRDVVEETVRVGEVTLRLSDTAGIHDTADAVEQLGVERSRRRLSTAALVLAVFDGSRPLSADDRELLELLPPAATIAVINKRDLTPRLDETALRKRFSRIVYTQAATGSGKDELTAAIEQVVGLDRLDGADPVLATERQRNGVMQAVEALREARDALETGLTPDAVSVSVDGALNALLELTGERATEAVVDGIFSRFCVGK